MSMLRRYPSIARRYPHSQSVDGQPASANLNVEASNQPLYHVRSTVVSPGISSEAGTCRSEVRDVASILISVSDEDKQIDFRDDPTSASISAESSQSFNGELGHSLSQP